MGLDAAEKPRASATGRPRRGGALVGGSWEVLDGLMVQDPRHRSCPLGPSKINPPLLAPLVSTPAAPSCGAGALHATLTSSTCTWLLPANLDPRWVAGGAPA